MRIEVLLTIIICWLMNSRLFKFCINAGLVNVCKYGREMTIDENENSVKEIFPAY